MQEGGVPHLALTASHAAEKAAAVELHPRLGGAHLDGAARDGVGDLEEGRAQLAVGNAVARDNEVVVVAVDNLVDARANGRRDGKVKRGVLDARELARGDEIGAHGRVVGHRRLDDVVEDGAAPGASEVEVRVVCHIDNRRRIRGAVVADVERVVVRELVRDLEGQRAGVALVAVLGHERQHDRVAHDLASPVFLAMTVSE